jgi:hypothetical protein
MWDQTESILRWVSQANEQVADWPEDLTTPPGPAARAALHEAALMIDEPKQVRSPAFDDHRRPLISQHNPPLAESDRQPPRSHRHHEQRNR